MRTEVYQLVQVDASQDKIVSVTPIILLSKKTRDEKIALWVREFESIGWSVEKYERHPWIECYKDEANDKESWHTVTIVKSLSFDFDGHLSSFRLGYITLEAE